MRRALSVVVIAASITALGSAGATVEPTLLQLRQLRAAAAEFEDVNIAKAAGYEQFGGCMSGPQGAQGIHFTNGKLIADPALNPLRPEALLYEPRPDGTFRLVAVEYIVFQAAWHGAGHRAPPVLLGGDFNLNTTLLDQPFYLLHVWVWQHNPLGLFANWNPLVTCPGMVSH